MIVVDTSAVIALLACEPEALDIAGLATAQDDIFMSVGTRLELSIVARAKWGEEGERRVAGVLSEMRAAFVAVDTDQMRLAIDAHRRFGRGSGHPARLNYGDCFAYALARSLDAPLLFKGDDFTHTDIRPALVPS